MSDPQDSAPPSSASPATPQSQFERAPLDQLLRLARREVEDDDPEASVPALVALHQRPTREVFEHGAALTGAGDAVKRVLGVRILRELGPEQEDGRRTFSAETIPLLNGMLGTETDPGVLRWIVSALGWHRGGVALPAVAALVDHPDVGVRYAVAWALPGLVTLTDVEAEAVRALTVLCRDEDADIRYYALYAITREIEGFDVELGCGLAGGMVDDPDGQVRGMAAGHLAAVGEVRRQLADWNLDGVPGASACGASDVSAGVAGDALIGPILVGLSCGYAAADLSEMLGERFGWAVAPAGTDVFVNRLLAWWQEQPD